MPGSPISDEQRERILTLARSGQPRNQVAREVGVSTSTVSRVTRAAGIGFARGRTEAATRARQADLRAARVALEAQLLDDAARVRAQLWQPHTLAAFSTKEGEFHTRRLPEPPPSEKLALAKATGALIDRSVKLALTDSDKEPEETRSMLGALHERLLVTYERHEMGDEAATGRRNDTPDDTQP